MHNINITILKLKIRNNIAYIKTGKTVKQIKNNSLIYRLIKRNEIQIKYRIRLNTIDNKQYRINLDWHSW